MSVQINSASDQAQERIARLALAYLESDNAQLTYVWGDILGDERGAEHAMQETIVGLAVGIVEVWRAWMTHEEVTHFLREQLEAIAVRGGE